MFHVYHPKEQTGLRFARDEGGEWWAEADETIHLAAHDTSAELVMIGTTPFVKFEWLVNSLQGDNKRLAEQLWRRLKTNAYLNPDAPN